MKPLLIIPPAPARWPAVRALPIHDVPLWWEDFEKRFSDGLPGSQDAFALATDGGLALACAGVCKRHDLGVLGRVYCAPEHRGRGHARAVVETVLTWFEMTGGKWLYATTTADLADGFLGKLGFRILRRVPGTPHDAVVLVRVKAGVPDDPLLTADGGFAVHDVSRANWPTLATLLYCRPGADPRVSLDESAISAETTALELIGQQESGACHLKAAFHGPRLVGLASVATNRAGERTHAMVMPHTDAPSQLRDAIVAFAKSKGFQHVDFPLEALAGHVVSSGPGRPVATASEAPAEKSESEPINTGA